MQHFEKAIQTEIKKLPLLNYYMLFTRSYIYDKKCFSFQA